MRHTRRRDRLAGVPVQVHIWRWHRLPVMAAVHIGRMDTPRPPWHIVAATVALQCISVGAAIFHWTLVYARW